MNTIDPPKYPVQTVIKAIEIINFLAEESGNRGVGISEFSRELDMGKSTVHRLLDTLQYYGYVEKNEETNCYRLGWKLYRVGKMVPVQNQIFNLDQQYLVELNKKTRETVNLGVLKRNESVIISKIDGYNDGLRVVVAPAEREAVHATALGKMLISEMDDEQIRTLIALFVVLLMVFFPKKWNAVVPASLIGIIIATAATMILKLDIATVGEIPKTLMLPDRLSPAQIDWNTVPALLAPAFSIAVLNMLESLLCGASAGRATGVKLNNDQELFAQGVGNMVLPMFGGIPATAALARTSVAVRSGAQTRLTGIFHAVGLLIMMFLLAPVIQNVPLAGLAGVLMVTAWRMNEWHAIKYMFSHRFKGAMAKFIVTMICTIVFDLTVAIVVGVGLGLILMVARLSKLQINYERVDMSRIKNNDEALNERYRNAMVAYITGPLIFANIDTIEQLTERVGTCDTLLLSMRGVPYIDISAAQALMDILRSLHENGVDIVLCGLPSSAMNMMHRSGIYDMVGEQGFYWSVERALLDLRPYTGKK